MAAKDINSLSPKYRDILLNQNIGKYTAITTPLIDPIGKQIDIFNSTPILKKSITNGNLLNYTNNNIKNDYYTQYRNLDSTIIEYIDSKSKYTKDYNYIDETSKGLVEQTTNGILSYLLGGEVNVGINNGNNFQINSSFDYGNTLPGLALNVSLGVESDLGKIGLRSLGLQLANSVLDKTRRSETMLKFLEKPLGYFDAIDKLDTEKLNLNLSTGISNFIGGTFPIYLYSEVREAGDKSFNVFKSNNSWSNFTGEVINTQTQSYHPIDDIAIKESLLYKTQQMFNSGKINTLIDELDNSNPKFENSDGLITKGRPLLMRDKKGNLIEGSYKRAWSASKQYRNVKDLIRPFDGKNNIAILKKDLKRVRPGAKSLETFGVLQDDGFIKISPYSKFDSKTDVHRYMFSLENLAWKQKDGFLDSLIQKSSQDGPNGGRIMWFPPYDIKFTDNTNVNWNSDNFIGRGEPVYTYVNTERAGSLSFKVIVDHPSILNYYKQKDPSGQIIKDDDYHRFFAGMDVVDLENIETENPKEEPQQKKPTPENKPNLIYEFKTYFPNNFSGIDLISNPNIFLKYLLHGENCNETTSIGPGYEFEVNNNHGITLSSFISGQTCQGNFAHKVDIEYEKQNVSYPNNRDNISFGLNNIKYNNNTNTLSFKEFINKVNYSPTTEELNKLRSVKKIVISGYSSGQGYAIANNNLAINRAKTMGAWLKLYDYFFSKDLKIEYKNLYKQTKDNITNDSTNSISVKKERCALIQMYSSYDATSVIEIGYSDTKPETITDKKPILISTATRTKVDMYGYTIKDNNSNLENDEAKFFEEIGKDKDFIFEQFSEKIKYFHPAFHSTTPEGFNSRLTFLHQCTRQGNTKNSAGLATNLAFGRPPICVLRIGDFYNTKIIIDNLNIDFEPLVWDMNPEGIGVQPMLANINMSFKFIGGSDLTGPIARLQNAITFNFFANTGVYDDRNDRIVTDSETGNKFRNKDGSLNNDWYDPMYNPWVYDNQIKK